MAGMKYARKRALRVVAAAAAAAAATTSYMIFEAQWPRCRESQLRVPGLPAPWSGIRVLHLSDVHAGLFPTNERSFRKVVGWAAPLEPDLVLLTGDILGDPRRSGPMLEQLGRLHAPLGMFAVTGNHEYGLGKGPFAKARDNRSLWGRAGVTLLSDDCFALPPRNGTRLMVCGADYLTGGFGLLESGDGGPASCGEAAPFAEAPRGVDIAPGGELAPRGGPGPGGGPAPGGGHLSILLIHEPPPSDSPLAALFPLAFAGHTHGGQLRVPMPSGLAPLVNGGGEYLSGVHRWGHGLLVVSAGVGTSFLPYRLLTRPEATLWRLVSDTVEDPQPAIGTVRGAR